MSRKWEFDVGSSRWGCGCGALRKLGQQREVKTVMMNEGDGRRGSRAEGEVKTQNSRGVRDGGGRWLRGLAVVGQDKTR